MAVQDARGARLSIIGMKSDTPGGTIPILEQRSREQIAFWEEGDLAFAIVGRLEGRQLLQRARELSAALAHARLAPGGRTGSAK